MAHRDAAHENQITSIHIHSVEWSDRSEPVQKRTFSGPYVHYKRDTIRNSESALVSLGSTQSIDRAFPERWLSRFAKLIIFLQIKYFSELLNR